MKPTKLIAALAALLIPLLGFFACANVKVADATGAWRDVPAASNVHVSDGATWHTGTQVYVSDGAAWHPVYGSSTITVSGSTDTPGIDLGYKTIVSATVSKTYTGDNGKLGSLAMVVFVTSQTGGTQWNNLTVANTVGGTYASPYKMELGLNNLTIKSGTSYAETITYNFTVASGTLRPPYPPLPTSGTLYNVQIGPSNAETFSMGWGGGFGNPAPTTTTGTWTIIYTK